MSETLEITTPEGIVSFPPSIVRKYEKRVERGATLLDEKLPGWWRHIRLTRLNMAVGVFEPDTEWCGCVGAQVANAYAHLRDTYSDGRRAGFYDNAMDFLFRRRGHQNEVSHGFVVGSRRGSKHDPYLLLDELWTEQVRARRKR